MSLRHFFPGNGDSYDGFQLTNLFLIEPFKSKVYFIDSSYLL